MNKSHISITLITFVAVLAGSYLLKYFLPRIDNIALIVGNAVMAALVFFGFFVVSRSVSKRPQAFVRGVYSATYLKLLVCMAGLLGYAVINKATLYKPTLFALFGIYLIYTIIETAVLSKTARKN